MSQLSRKSEALEEDGVKARELERIRRTDTRLRVYWTPIEVETFSRIVREAGPTIKWKNIAHGLPRLTACQCRRH